ncbi:MAG: threonine--tRNA ligase [Frankiaceae bacterium]
MPDVRITLDRSLRIVSAGTTVGEICADAGIEPGRGAIAVRVNEIDLRDLSWMPEDGDRIETIPVDTDDGRAILRHSTAHVLAQAVQDLFPRARLGIGPPITAGFYYDFDVETPFTPADLERIEARMREIVAERQRFSRRVVSDDEARTELADEPYKVELIGLKGTAGAAVEGADIEVGAGELTIYDNLRQDGELAWKDLCRGPHLPTTADIPAFRLMRSAAAYWRGSERNPQLQRIYGTAWESQEALDGYLHLLEEAERRDHRRLGVELDLFSFPSIIGGGLAVWHPKGGAIRRAMEDYSRHRHERAGYSFVVTPHIARSTLFETSGHLEWYADGMYPPMEMEGARYYPKPMNCPFHIQVYKSRGRSYRDLPMRLFELGTVYRFEKSGVLHGLTRARGFTQDDAHIFCTPEQLGGELTSLLAFVVDLLRDFGLTEFEAELAVRDDSKDYIGTDEQWAAAESALRAAVEVAGLPYVVAPGEATYYAPKVDIHVRDAIGRRWQLSTLQVDFQLPLRFDMEYQDADGSRRQPYMIHRALFGSEERFFAILLEHYAGAMPPWLAPVQVAGIPIRSDNVAYLEDVADRLRARGLRVEVDGSDERMQKKIAKAQTQKVPYMLIAGPRDVGAGAVSVRYRNGVERRGVPVPEVIEEIARVVDNRLVDPDALNPDEAVRDEAAPA